MEAAGRLAASAIVRDVDVAYAGTQTKAIETMVYIARPNYVPMRIFEGLTGVSSFTKSFFESQNFPQIIKASLVEHQRG
jgi:hypothetical protein